MEQSWNCVFEFLGVPWSGRGHAELTLCLLVTLCCQPLQTVWTKIKPHKKGPDLNLFDTDGYSESTLKVRVKLYAECEQPVIAVKPQKNKIFFPETVICEEIQQMIKRTSSVQRGKNKFYLKPAHSLAVIFQVSLRLVWFCAF